jgi:RNase adapter protein RapZ
VKAEIVGSVDGGEADSDARADDARAQDARVEDARAEDVREGAAGDGSGRDGSDRADHDGAVRGGHGFDRSGGISGGAGAVIAPGPSGIRADVSRGDGRESRVEASPEARAQTDLVIVTGLSGGGRSTVARALENVGYYVVDNLPQALMLDMAELAYKAGGAAKRTAMVLDVRSRAFSGDLAGAVAALRASGFSPRVVFVDADDEVLIRRFESVRRSHPLQGSGRLADGIAAERELLLEARDTADVLIDTSHLNVNQLRNRVEELFGGEDARKLRATVLSFGFKYGLPPDADFVLDARFLPNPFWEVDLRDQTGLDEAVSRYVLNQAGARTFVESYARLITATAPGFEREGKRYLTVAVGCTGGKHRSVAIAEELSRRLRDLRVVVATQHRDLGRE